MCVCVCVYVCVCWCVCVYVCVYGMCAVWETQHAQGKEPSAVNALRGSGGDTTQPRVRRDAGGDVRIAPGKDRASVWEEAVAVVIYSRERGGHLERRGAVRCVRC